VRAENGDPDSGAAEKQGGRIAAIQLLRALAALTVAAGHIAFAFADHLPGGLGIAPEADGRSGQVAVMLFFVISGYVMVVSSEALFGRAGARWIFWRRRLVRVMPPYWIASGLLALIFLILFPQPIDLLRFGQSLLLIPYWPADGTLRAVPFLWVGWTLFYEMLFYAMFGLFVVWRREAAIAGVAALLAGLCLAGLWVDAVNAPLFTATRPVTLIFVAGMLLALWRARGGSAPPWLRAAMLAGAFAVWWGVPMPADPSAMGFGYLLCSGLPALLLALAALSGPLAVPAADLVNRAGDASYALYLLHVPLAWFWLWFWGRLPGFDAGPWDYLVSALAASIAASWLFHRWIERPMTLALNRRLRSPHGHERSA
jgi:peptidoglycan/LPS O-acetylase OafA/YrhL